MREKGRERKSSLVQRGGSGRNWGVEGLKFRLRGIYLLLIAISTTYLSSRHLKPVIITRFPFREMDDDDADGIPQLVTLDTHLSDEMDAKLKGSFNPENESRDSDNDTKKVPITILTGTQQPRTSC